MEHIEIIDNFYRVIFGIYCFYRLFFKIFHNKCAEAFFLKMPARKTSILLSKKNTPSRFPTPSYHASVQKLKKSSAKHWKNKKRTFKKDKKFDEAAKKKCQRPHEHNRIFFRRIKFLNCKSKNTQTLLTFIQNMLYLNH